MIERTDAAGRQIDHSTKIPATDNERQYASLAQTFSIFSEVAAIRCKGLLVTTKRCRPAVNRPGRGNSNGVGTSDGL